MNTTTLGAILVAIPIALAVYAYLLYPLLLKAAAGRRRPPPPPVDPAEWPFISISLPAYNEEQSIRATLERLLQLDYPAERRQILVISDASTDRTDDIVREFADRGVELLRLSRRAGKTAAENAAASHLRGDIVINTDATIRIPPTSVKPLVRVFQDPTIGVASGRDISVGRSDTGSNHGESGYVGYEMWLRSLETRVGSIVGASGCFYAIRRQLVNEMFPEALSRDFASPLRAREAGFRTVSVDEAVCLVPRTTSLHSEFTRKVRTMARGLETLWYQRALLNPFRYGSFAWMLASHKLCRWLVHLVLPLALVGLALLAPSSSVASALLVVAAVVLMVGGLALGWRGDRPLPRPIAAAGFFVAVNVAALAAWGKALRGERNPIWEPTRRPSSVPASGSD
ncbi:MAG TPA: glycosyltransferase [Gemmatimonadales bacterium]|nr:glycosyltransferase [Gemmatimonadales bacterium]